MKTSFSNLVKTDFITKILVKIIKKKVLKFYHLLISQRILTKIFRIFLFSSRINQHKLLFFIKLFFKNILHK